MEGDGDERLSLADGLVRLSRLVQGVFAEVSARLFHSLETNAPPKNREEEAARAKARAAERFGA